MRIADSAEDRREFSFEIAKVGRYSKAEQQICCPKVDRKQKYIILRA